MTESPLQSAIAILKSGDRKRAHLLLSAIVTDQPLNISAWLWLSGAVDSDAERRHCLERVLELDPQNTAAQRGLTQLPKPSAPTTPTPQAAQPDQAQRITPLLSSPTSSLGQAALDSQLHVPEVLITSAVVALPSAQPTPYTVGRSKPAKRSRIKMWLGITAGTVLVFCLICIVGIGTLTLFRKRGDEPVRAVSQPPASWKKFTSNSTTLWLPASFVGGDLATHKAATIEEIRSLGPEYHNIAQAAQQSSSTDLWMVDGNDETGYSINVNIAKEYVARSLSMEQYLDHVVANGADQMRLISREVEARGPHSQGRLVLEKQDSGRTARAVIYVVKSGRTCWIVSYGTDAANYSRALSIAEQSIRTFAVTLQTR